MKYANFSELLANLHCQNGYFVVFYLVERRRFLRYRDGISSSWEVFEMNIFMCLSGWWSKIFKQGPKVASAPPPFITPSETGVVEISSVIVVEDCLALSRMGVEFLEWSNCFPFEYMRRAQHGAYLQRVRLPNGWCKRRLGGSAFWWDIFDEKGRERAQTFYKCSPNEKRVEMTVCARYKVVHMAYQDEERRVWSVRDVDGTILFTSGEYKRHTSEEIRTAGNTDHDLHRRMCEEDVAECNRAQAECEAWLDLNFPEWRNKSAYWD